jgi:DNA-binding transcriptional ArsR family regulator
MSRSSRGSPVGMPATTASRHTRLEDLRAMNRLARFAAVAILSQMANQSPQLSEVFYALADPTRRAIVSVLGRGPESVSMLAAPFAMALPSFMKHLAVLERSGVIRSNKVGRVRTCELLPKTLSHAERWIAEQRATWEARTDRMAAFVEKLHQEDLSRGQRNTRRR